MTIRFKINPVAQFYWRYVRRYPRFLTGSIISVPITIIINDFLPTLILAAVLGRLSEHNYDAGRLWHSFGPELLLYGAALVVGSLCWRLVDFCAWQLEERVQQAMAQQVFNYLVSQSADFHANSFSGTLVSHTNKLLGGYVRVADTTTYGVYPLVCTVVFTTIILLPRAPLYTLVFFVFAVSFFAATFWISRPVRKAGALHAGAESKQTGYLADAVTNALAIKSFARGQYERERFAKVTDNTRNHLVRVSKYVQIQMLYLGTFSRLISFSALVMAVVSAVMFKVNIATVFLIFSYTNAVVEQLFQFGNSSLRNYNRAFGDAADMVETLSRTPSVVDPEQPEPSRIKNGRVVFDRVAFKHNGADTAIFDALSLTIEPGEHIGLVGHSGSGKTTFTRLLLRFSDIQDGQVLIDGQNIARITQNDLHSNIAYVPQEPLLFHRSIRENIAYGDLSASQADIERAASLANASEFIDALPNRYDTLVGERGIKLSGGQRQRIAIARAMLKGAPVLVLDEATSALDSASEVLIQQSLWKLMENRTAIVIAHRLSTIQKMDRIIVLDDGHIVEQGSHKELLKNNGTYAKLWAHQSGGFIDE